MTRILSIAILAAAALTLAACQKQVAAPTQMGICWQAIPLQNKDLKFNQVATGVANMETCAADLEAMRLRFLNLGGSRQEVIGAYQGNFLFLEPQGVFLSQSYTGARWFALGRNANGDLATAAALSQEQQQQ